MQPRVSGLLECRRCHVSRRYELADEAFSQRVEALWAWLVAEHGAGLRESQALQLLGCEWLCVMPVRTCRGAIIIAACLVSRVSCLVRHRAVGRATAAIGRV